MHLTLNKAYDAFRWLGFAALLLMAQLAMITDKFGSRAGKVAIATGIILLLVRWRQYLRSPLLALLCAAVLLQLLVWWGMQSHYPNWAESSPKVGRLANWFMMIPVAVLLVGQRWRIALLWGLFAASLIISPWITGGGWAEVLSGINGKRIDFGVRNAQHVAMLFGVILIGSFALLIHLIMSQSFKFSRLIPCLLLLIISVYAVVVTQTRAVWLALSLVLVACLIMGLVFLLNNKGRLKPSLYVCLAGALIAVFVIMSAGETFQKRFNHEYDNIQIALSGSSDYQSNNSTGVRLSTWYESIDWIKERPLMGWGGNGRDLVVKHTDRLTEHSKQRYRHLHNSYLDTLVNYGVLGLLCMLLLFGYLARAVLILYRSGQVQFSEAMAGLMVLIYFLVVNCFESYMFYSSGQLVLAFIGGAILSLYWKTQKSIV